MPPARSGSSTDAPAADIRQRLAKAAIALEEAREERDLLIAEATELGLSRRDVGEAVGMTAAGVQHVLKGRRGSGRSGAGPGPSAAGDANSSGPTPAKASPAGPGQPAS